MSERGDEARQRPSGVPACERCDEARQRPGSVPACQRFAELKRRKLEAFRVCLVMDISNCDNGTEGKGERKCIEYPLCKQR